MAQSRQDAVLKQMWYLCGESSLTESEKSQAQTQIFPEMPHPARNLDVQGTCENRLS